MSAHADLHAAWGRLRRRALIVGAAGIALCLLGLLFNRAQAFRSWLFAYQFFLALGAGGLAMLMVHHLMGGQWGLLVLRIFESLARTLPLLALLFVPVLFGMHDIYEWTHQDVVAATPRLAAKAPYLNIPFFIGRAAFYFLIWSGFAWWFSRKSLERDRTGDPAITLSFVRASAFGIIIFFFTMTFAAIDWMMSIEPEWHSTIYGAVVIMGQGLQALVFSAIVLAWVGDTEAVRPLVAPKALIDLGNMLLAFVVIWTYMAFIQYLVIWMGNLTDEIPWVLHRTRGGWQAVAISLIVLHFFLPFFMLLFRTVKRRLSLMMKVAALILVMRLVATHWLIAPSFHPRLSLHWLDLAALAAVGGIWTAVFLGILGRVRLAPLNDPRQQAAVYAEEGAHG